MAASQNYNVNLNINANAQSAAKTLQNLQKQLQQISTMQFDVGIGNITPEIEKASQAAMKLSAHLATAMNPQTGNLDFTKFYTSIQKSGMSLQAYGKSLQDLGPAGQRAFIGLADSIAKSEIPLKRTSTMVNKMWDGLKRTAGWQLQSSVIHGIIGGVQKAVGYAKDLNKSLTDIRIVTGQSTDQMAKFAEEANKAAKKLSTTTTDYTKASLIYYQQGLSDAEVKARTETTIKMANATGTSAQKVSDQMTAIWNNYDNGTKSLTHYADVMTALGAATASSTDEIAQGLQKFASISNTVGLSYEYAASALATITAESRESADVVGNALKTLFSRIQGLQLGETLDDGTTLNKYSNALAKVGISIKDQSGELKNMDDILNEMGTRWSTLARDEKMALAQTVAGVRQYTQLMTLMENWDDFQKNLTTAKTSAGTLDTQALIYAESWEAASKRMRASWEGLWDNLIDSEGMSDVLDLLSSFANILTTITTGMGGAKGVLSSFSALFLKLFTPQIGASINNMAYGIKMMFGGKNTMQQARDQWLIQAKNSLSADSAFFNIGQAEGKAYQDMMSHKIATSLAFSRHWDTMNTEERLYAQQQQANYEQFGQQYLAAGQQYDKSKNELSDAYWDLYKHGNVKDGKISHPLEQSSELAAWEKEQLAANRAKLAQGKAEVGQGRSVEYWTNKGIPQAEATIARLEAKSTTYGTRLRSQASAMLDFEKTIGSFGNDSQKNMKAFTDSWSKMDNVLSTTDPNKIPLGATKFKETMESLIQAGDIEGAQSYFRTQANGLNEIVARTLAEQAGLDPATFSQYMSGATQAEIDKRNYEAYQAYQKKLEEQQLKGRRTNPANWGQGLVSAAQGAMGAISLKQQIDTLSSGNLSAGETMSAVASSAMSAGMAVTGFSSALTATGLAVGKAAGVWGAALSAIIVLLSYGLEELEKKYKADKIAAEQAAKTASLTANAHQEAVTYSESLKTQISSYQEANDVIRSLTYGSQEREEAIYEANKQALSLISQNNLQEGIDYTKIGNQIQIKEDALTNLQEEAEAKVLATDAAAQLSSLAAQVATAKSNAADIRKQALKEKGAGDVAQDIAGWLQVGGAGMVTSGMGVAAMGAGSTATVIGAIPGLTASALGLITAGVGTAIAAGGTVWMNHISKYQNEIAKGMKYVTENGVEVLNKTAGEIATELGISQEAAELLEKNKDQLAKYAKTMSEQDKSLELVTDNIARNIMAKNKSVSKSDYATEISNAAGKAYQKKYEEERSKVEQEMATDDAGIRAAAQRYADLMGYSDYSQFKLGDIDKDNKTISYSYWDAESQDTVTKEMAYDQITSSLGSAEAEKYLNGEWAKGSLEIAKELNKLTGGKGLFSLVTGGDFGNTSIKQIKEFQDNFDELGSDILEKTRKQFGYTEDEWNSLINESKALNVNVFDEILSKNGFNDSRLFDKGRYEDWMSMGNLQSLTREMISLGADAGTAFSNGLFDMLSQSGIDQNKWSNAIDLLLNSVDWNSWDALTQARLVIESLNGTLDTGSQGWQDFANSMREAQGAIPDFANMINQLTEVLVLLNSLSQGDIIDKDIYGALIEFLGGKSNKFAQAFKVNAEGNYEFIGTSSAVDDMREAAVKKMEDEYELAKQRQQDLTDVQKKLSEEHGPELTWDEILQSSDEIKTILGSSTDVATLNRDLGQIQSTIVGNDNGKKGYQEALDEAKLKLETAKTQQNTDYSEERKLVEDRLATAKSQISFAAERLKLGEVKFDENGQFLGSEVNSSHKKYVDAVTEYKSAWLELQKIPTPEKIAEDIVNAENDVLKYEKLILEAKQKEEILQNEKNSIIAQVNNFMESTLEDVTDESKEQLISAKYDTYSRFEEGKLSKDTSIANFDETGKFIDYTEKGIKQLKSLAYASELGQEAVDAYHKAEEKNLFDGEAGQALKEQLTTNIELATAIGEVSAARDIEASLLQEKLAYLQKTRDLEEMSISEQVELAAKYLESEQALESLKKNYQDLSKAIDDNVEGSSEWNNAMSTIKKSLAKVSGFKASQISTEFLKAAKASGLLEKALTGDNEALFELMSTMSIYNAIVEETTDATQEQALVEAYQTGGIDGMIDKLGEYNKDFAAKAEEWNSTLESYKTFTPEQLFGDETGFQTSAMNWVNTLGTTLGLGMKTLGDFSAAARMAGFEMITEDIGEADLSAIQAMGEGAVIAVPTDDKGGYALKGATSVQQEDIKGGSVPLKRVRFKPLTGGNSAPSGGGGGGGKQPKKVAQTRRSQVVKRYKNVDSQRAVNQNRRENITKKTDKLYGESRITNLQKENKLLEEGLKLNEKKAEEALKNLKIDEESLRKMTKKYGYELELDSEGNIKNYEQILGDIYDELHKLELDGELSEEEEKIKEKLEIKKQEIEGAMEDWEDTLKQLEELNNEYEELIDEMHSNELEQITYKLEFELELNELDTEWLNFLTERIGDDFTRASESMDLIIDKIKIVKNNIELYKKSIDDLMLNIQNDADRSLITGYLEDGVLTDEEAEILRDKGYGGLIEEFNKLAELKASAEELLVSVLDGYKNRIDLNITSLEHYTSLMEHFGNVVDIVGQKQLGLSDKFIENMAKMRIQQSRDVMSVAQSELASYEQERTIAETNLQKAREANDADSIAFWQEQLDTTNTMIQEARDKLVTSFEDNLNAIADAFDKAVERIVQTFNDAVYAFGGLEGLSEDYSFIRENTELMAQDYEKIYELSKLNRNINKTLNDNNIIAGKQKMIELQKEINDLQASGAELSKYDLEYLQAKYELRLAEIELENAQNAKETVRLSKDSEGNWSYVYTASTEKIDEAQQKYEDALYKMQNLSYEYIDEMSEKIISASQAMMEEIQNLNKNNFENEQEYLEEINRIKAKYAESLGVTEEELNKALANNEELYDKDWQSYSNKTGYAISESQNWIDRYAESTLGTLMKSTSDVADYMNNFSIALDELTNSIYRVAGDYYNGIDEAFAAAGITKEDFASFVTTNTKAIMDASTKAREDAKTQAEILKKEYDFLAGQISNVQLDIKNTLGDYTPLLTEIRDILRESAALTKELQNNDATYTYKQAADLFNSKYGEDYKIEMDAEGRWNKTVEGVKNEILQKHAEAKTDEEKKHYADMYTWLTSYILPYVTSLDTGGYTGEWGTSGRLAMLHEKELILNANDTANFLDALNVSRELVNRVIEMNARASSFGIGGLSPSSIQDFAQNLEQQVTITAEFPNAVDHNEIEEAFASLINTASQYANRK